MLKRFKQIKVLLAARLLGASALALGLASCGGPPVVPEPPDTVALPPGVAPAALMAAGAGAWVAGHTLGPVTVGAATLTPRGGAVLLGLDLQKGLTLALGIGGTGPVRINALRRDAAGDGWVVGTFSVKVALGRALLDTAGGDDCFVARLDPLGNVRWATRYGGPGDERCVDLALDADGAWVLGDFGLPVDPPNEAVSSLESQGGRDLFVLRVGPKGDLLSVVRFGGPGDEAAVSIDASGGGLAFTGTFTQDFRMGVALLGTPVGGPGAFVAGLRGDLLPLWGRVLGDTGSTLRAVRAAADGGWLVVGELDGVATLLRLAANGTSAWKRDLPGWTAARALDRDGSDALVAGSGAGARLVRVGSDGTVVSQWQCGGGDDTARAVAARPDGDVWYVADFARAARCAPAGSVLGRWRN